MSAPNGGPDPNRGRTGTTGGRLLPVGRFFGVPLYFAPSWILIAILITISYNSFFYDSVDGLSHAMSYVAAVGFAVLLALSVLAHELGHVSVSLLLGKPVRRVVIFLLGGMSEIEKDPDRPRDEFLVAIAGPLVSGVVVGAAALAQQFMADGSLPAVLLWLLAWSNLIVAVFNLLPGLPLDGGRILRAGLWRLTRSRVTGTRVAAWVGRGVAILVAVPGIFFPSRATLPTALFGIVLGAFIWFGATQSLRAAVMQERLPALALPALLRPGLMVAGDVSVAEVLRRAWQHRARGLVVVDGADRPRAIVDERRISAVPTERQAWTAVSEVARPLEPGLTLPVSLSGDELLAAVRAVPASEYLVVHPDGSPAGILATADLAGVLASGSS
jgi:Zn-dependent protease/CBS domain-containing protein